MSRSTREKKASWEGGKPRSLRSPLPHTQACCVIENGSRLSGKPPRGPRGKTGGKGKRVPPLSRPPPPSGGNTWGGEGRAAGIPDPDRFCLSFTEISLLLEDAGSRRERQHQRQQQLLLLQPRRPTEHQGGRVQS